MKLCVTSNRLPVTATERANQISYQESSGGLVSGLSAYLDYLRLTAFTPMPCVWVGWPGGTISPKQEAHVRQHLRAHHQAVPVFLSEKIMDKFYHGFCNKTVWPLFHYFPTYTVYDQSYWESYQKVNNLFADVLVQDLEPDDVLWIHDYHLMLLPSLVRKRRPELQIGFFLHIPFPSYEIFRLLPAAWRHALLEGLLGADLIGFHTHDYSQDFLKCVLRLLGYEHKLGKIFLPDRLVQVETFPMGIDYNRYHDALNHPVALSERHTLQTKTANKKIMLSIDRLDYTKGLTHRLLAYERFLENNRDWHEFVTFVLLLVPSRTRVEHYQIMKRQIDELVGKINGRFSTMDWIPVQYMYRFMSFHELVALYSCSDVALITPLRDGMNLVAKEYLACRPDNTGVLILSEMAGAVKELGEALIINPNNLQEMESAIKEALTMPAEEQIRRNENMQRRLQRYDVVRWASDFFERLDLLRAEQKKLHTRYFSRHIRQNMLEAYHRARTRLLFLDYDGTLVPFHTRPEKALPPQQLIELLQRLTADARTQVVIISGRDKTTLESWFAEKADLHMVAEHGVWLKERDQEWRLFRTMDNNWKHSIRPLLELYTDRLPGSAIEEKEYSLVWHYRAADSEPAALRSQELVDELLHYTGNMDLQVLPGNKVVEVKNQGIHKGSAAQFWIDQVQPDFILAMGDDITDENMFSVLPAHAYSVKVGYQLSQANYFVYNNQEVVTVLQELIADSVA